jgi:hypothetical protein
VAEAEMAGEIAGHLGFDLDGLVHHSDRVSTIE